MRPAEAVSLSHGVGEKVRMVTQQQRPAAAESRSLRIFFFDDDININNNNNKKYIYCDIWCFIVIIFFFFYVLCLPTVFSPDDRTRQNIVQEFRKTQRTVDHLLLYYVVDRPTSTEVR